MVGKLTYYPRNLWIKYLCLIKWYYWKCRPSQQFNIRSLFWQRGSKTSNCIIAKTSVSNWNIWSHFLKCLIYFILFVLKRIKRSTRWWSEFAFRLTETNHPYQNDKRKFDLQRVPSFLPNWKYYLNGSIFFYKILCHGPVFIFEFTQFDFYEVFSQGLVFKHFYFQILISSSKFL